MGWWTYEDDEDLKWGDEPADAMDTCLNEVFRAFQNAYGRDPTEEELRRGLAFSAQPLLEEETSDD